jgi:hypothetical protein
MTLRTTAHLATAPDDNYSELIKARGLDCARLFYQSLKASIDRIAAIQTAENIDCDFCRLDGYWILAPTTPAAELDNELKACEKIGIPVEDCREQTPVHRRTARTLAAISRSGALPSGQLSCRPRCCYQTQRRSPVCKHLCSPRDQKQGQLVLDTASGHKIKAANVVVATTHR